MTTEHLAQNLLALAEGIVADFLFFAGYQLKQAVQGHLGGVVFQYRQFTHVHVNFADQRRSIEGADGIFQGIVIIGGFGLIQRAFDDRFESVGQVGGGGAFQVVGRRVVARL